MQPLARFVEREPVSDESCEKQSAALGYHVDAVRQGFCLRIKDALNQELLRNTELLVRRSV